MYRLEKRRRESRNMHAYLDVTFLSRNSAKFSMLFVLVFSCWLVVCFFFLHQKYFKACPLFAFFAFHIDFAYSRKLAAEMVF